MFVTLKKEWNGQKPGTTIDIDIESVGKALVTEGIAEEVKGPVGRDQDDDRDADRQQDRDLGSPTPAVVVLDAAREEAHPGQGQEDVVGADDRRVAGEDQEQGSRDRHVAGQETTRHVRCQQRHELIGVRVGPIEQRG